VNVREAPLPGVLIIEPIVHRDSRGFLSERFSQDRYWKAGITERFVQDNLAESVRGSLRGLHYQVGPAHSKLVEVPRGRIFDVVVDVRVGSSTFGQWHAEILDDQNLRQLYVPIGFAHGFCVLSEVAHINYKFSEYYDPERQRGIRWDDPALAIDWPVRNPTLSRRDAMHPRLDQIELVELKGDEAAAQHSRTHGGVVE
jgi:dTDP-4-dehydrorhamnose 3,5-epimerase